MTEFKAGEYPMRNGQTAVVLGEIPNPRCDHCCLVGYGVCENDGCNNLLLWAKNGEYDVTGIKHGFDLMPRKRKIEQWIFSWHRIEDNIKRSGVLFFRSYQEACDARSSRIGVGWLCSEIVQAPTLEIEE
jgi:hypothetical protein